MRNLSLWIPLFADGQAYYDIMLPAIWLGVPSESTGTTLVDRSGNGNDATITPDSEYSNHTNEQKMLKGNGTRYASVPTDVGLNNDDITMAVFITLPTFDTVTALLGTFIDGNNRLFVAHQAAKTIRITHYQNGTTIASDITGIPENELLLIVAKITSTDFDLFICHGAGRITNNMTLAGVMVGSHTAITFGSRNATSPILSGTYIGVETLYNKTLTEPEVQAMYDQLMGRTLGVELMPNGDFSDTLAWTSSGSPDIFAIESGVLHISDDENVNSWGYLTSGIELVAGNVYVWSAQANKNDVARLLSFGFAGGTSAGVSNPNLTGVIKGDLNYNGGELETIGGMFLCTATHTAYPQVLLNDAAYLREVWIDNITLKQVTNTGVLAPNVVYSETISNDSISAEVGYPDMDLYYRLTTLPSSGTYEFYARYIDADNNIRVSINFSTGVATLYELDATVETSLGVGGTFSNGELLRVVLSATQITVYENGTEIITNTSSVGLTEETILTDTGDGEVTVTATDLFGV